jgi:PBP1b-binding outer membrane lipoprotein LpoB
MRIITVLFVIVLMAGCSSNSVKPLTTNHTDSLTMMEMPTISAEPLAPKPDAVVIIDPTTQEEVVAFSPEGIDALMLMRKQATKNIELVEALGTTLQAIVQERNALVNMAKEQERRSNAMAQSHAHTEEKLRREEKMRSLEKFGYQILLLLGLAAGI